MNARQLSRSGFGSRLLAVPLAVERIEGDPEADQAQVVILAVRHLLDAGHPTARPVEADGRGLFALQGCEPLFVRLPAVAQVVDGRDGSEFGHFVLVPRQ